MPALLPSLQGNDIGYLRIVAELWGVDLTASHFELALQELTAALLDPDLVAEVVSALPAEARSALQALIENGGRIPWAAFARRFGEIRQAGPARRDRERLYLQPISAAEALFYRALLARAFFDTPSGTQEFAYVPEDLLSLLEKNMSGQPEEDADSQASFSERQPPLGRPASPKERERPLPVCDRLLDDATTLLAALRMGLPPPVTPVPGEVVRLLLQEAGILASSPQGEQVNLDAVRQFLETPRAEALAWLRRAWQSSDRFDELRLMPALLCEGDWQNRPAAARQFLLDLLAAIPPARWWSLAAFVRDVKEKYPDFQRPAGNYDSWIVKRRADGVYLRGFSSWDEVDGAWIRYFITGPLYWLGMTLLATPADDETVTAFQVVPPARLRFPAEEGRARVTSQGRIVAPRLLPRPVRYQIARFCEWEPERPDEYRYRVTPASLTRARQQGLKVGQLLSLLAKHAAAEVPLSFIRALQRWEQNGSEARVETQTILRVSRPEVLDELRRSKAGRFLGEALGPAAVVVRKGAVPQVLATLAELGLLVEEERPESQDNPLP
ncbi:MAG: helicase-associated domain-containing protein [Anaerolineales bacterium]